MKNFPFKILMIDDDLENLRSTQALLGHWGYESLTAPSGLAGVREFIGAPAAFPIVLLDLNMPDIGGLEVLAEIKRRRPDACVIIYSCDPMRDQLKAAIRAGADDFVLKDEGIEILRRVLETAVDRVRPSTTHDENEKAIRAAGMVGRSAALAEVARLCVRFGENRYPVLLIGETGSGKELAARAIHGISRRPFLPYNCATTTQTGLLESELFGSLRGAFTGSIGDRVGILEAAKDGTVFLDEIHHLGLGAQASLLRVLSQNTVRRVGSTGETAIHCRFVAAAKPELDPLVADGRFLHDLMFRLDVLRIEIPPLRSRLEDLEMLCEFFLAELGGKISLSASAYARLREYAFLGNVRELQSWMTALTLKHKGTVDADAIQREFGKRLRPAIAIAAPLSEVDPERTASVETMTDLERDYLEKKGKLIAEALNTAKSQREAALKLGINESSLRAFLRGRPESRSL